MEELIVEDKKLIREEDQLIKRIYTCDQATTAILGIVYKQRESLNLEIIEEIITAIHTITQDLQTELLHVRLEKSLVQTNK